jgi:hypothetical protein
VHDLKAFDVLPPQKVVGRPDEDERERNRGGANGKAAARGDG